MDNRRLRTPPMKRGGVSAIGGVVIIINSLLANAGVNQLLSGVALLTLDGSLSSGPITGSVWTQVSGPAAVIVNAGSLITLVTGVIPGTYVFQLSLNGGSSIAQVTETVTL